MVRTPSGERVPVCVVTRPPLGHQRVLDAELVERPPDDEVEQLVDPLPAVVEAGRKEEDRRPGLAQLEHSFEMDRRERRLARHDHELAALLERDARRTLDQVRHRPGRDRAQRAHRAGTDHIAVDPGRAARRRRAPVALVVDRHRVTDGLDQPRERLVRRQLGVPVQLGCQHLDARARGAERNLTVGAGEGLEQPSRVWGPRGPGYADENAHGCAVSLLRALGRL